MQSPLKPHVSPALAQLRFGVTGAALAVAAAAVVQMLVFGFVHFTQVRWSEPAVESKQNLSVVVGAPAKPGTVTTPVASIQAGERPAEQPVAAAAQPRARQLSSWDAALKVTSDIAVTVGVIGTCVLAALVGLGVVVAAGGGVPGAERAVSAMSWSLVLALACIPWRDVLPTVPFPGVFGGYGDMVALSGAVDAGQSGTMRLLAMYLLMPFAAFSGAVLALHRFRDGVAQGVIVTSVNDLDERLEREMAGIRARGVASGAMARSVGALNQAIGDVPAAAPRPAMAPAATAPTEAPIGRMIPDEPEPKTGRSWLNRRERRIGEPDTGEGLRRPV